VKSCQENPGNDRDSKLLKNNSKRITLFKPDNKRESLDLAKDSTPGEINMLKESSVLSINNPDMIRNLTSKSIFINKKPLSFFKKIENLKPIKEKPCEDGTYEQLIERTGQFNIIPNINKHPLYNHFQKQLNKLLGSSDDSMEQENLQGISLQSNLFNFQFETKEKENAEKSIHNNEENENKPTQNNDQLISIKIKSPGVSKFLKSDSEELGTWAEDDLHLDNFPRDFDDYSRETQNPIIENLKTQDEIWNQILSENQLVQFVERFQVKSCELLFLHLVIIFNTELSNKVPKYSEILKKMKGESKGTFNQEDTTLKSRNLTKVSSNIKSGSYKNPLKLPSKSYKEFKDLRTSECRQN
jgi:hypothetical protein